MPDLKCRHFPNTLFNVVMFKSVQTLYCMDKCQDINIYSSSGRRKYHQPVTNRTSRTLLML